MPKKLQHWRVKHDPNSSRYRYPKERYRPNLYGRLAKSLLGYPQADHKEIEYIRKGEPFQILPIELIIIIIHYIEDLQKHDTSYINHVFHHKEYINMDITNYKQLGVFLPSDFKFMHRFCKKKKAKVIREPSGDVTVSV